MSKTLTWNELTPEGTELQIVITGSEQDTRRMIQVQEWVMEMMEESRGVVLEMMAQKRAS